MAWILVSPDIHSTFASLGVQQGDSYKVSSDCLYHLNIILDKLVNENPTLRTFRRAIGFAQNIKKDLLPLLINVKNDDEILNCTIKILVNLTVPVECLLSTEAMFETDIGRHTIFELNRLLTTTKEAFVDSRTTKAILDHIKQITEGNQELKLEECDSINNCLLLLRNILHIPAIKDISQLRNSVQNQILWNLFTQHIDKIILHLIAHPQTFDKNVPVIFWGVTVVQLIALMFKDQHVGTLHKLLNLWFDGCLSDSSEDNESNTSPSPGKAGSNDSSPMLTSDPTSDSSDNCNSKSDRSNGSINSNQSKTNHCHNSKGGNQNSYNTGNSKNGPNQFRGNGVTACMKKISQRLEHTIAEATSPNSQTKTENSLQNNQKSNGECNSELSDRGYVTQMEKESISTSSNDDDAPRGKPVHQKPPCQKKRFKDKSRATTVQEKKELRRKKLVKRSKTHIINMKGLLYHSPTDEDISNILKEFTVDFLLKGFNYLVDDLRNQLLTDLRRQIDTSHFFWLITYFLKFSTQLELELEHTSSVLSYDIISYLIFEGVFLCEQLDIQRLQEQDLRPTLRRIHLVVTSIREFIQTIDMYRKMTNICPEDKEYIMQLQVKIASTEQFKCLFLLLLRQFNANIQNLQYLQDLITTNHISLLLLDNVSKLPECNGELNMIEHLQKFATTEIMHQYGLLLENFLNNGEYVNDCIFTMMHHVSGDLNRFGTLFQPRILKTFSKIWEIDYEICDDWSDLIEFVIHKFINTPRPNSDDSLLSVKETLSSDCESRDDRELLSFYLKSQNDENPIESIIQIYAHNGINMSKESIIKSLSEHKLISDDNYESAKNTQMDYLLNSSDTCPEIAELKNRIIKENWGEYLKNLQTLLLDTCLVKLKLAYPNEEFQSNTSGDPIAYFSCVMKLAVPLVPWTSKSKRVHSSEIFRSLLKVIGLYLPEDNTLLYPRIPESWTPDRLFQAALSLGPVDTKKLNFDTQLLKMKEEVSIKMELEEKNDEKVGKPISYSSDPFHPVRDSIIHFTPMPNSPTNWLQTVMKSNANKVKIADVTNITTEINIDIPTTFVSIFETPPELSIANVRTPKSGEMENFSLDSTPVFLDGTDAHSVDTLFMSIDEIEDHPENVSDAISVSSDLTRMYVSDEETISSQ